MAPLHATTKQPSIVLWHSSPFENMAGLRKFCSVEPAGPCVEASRLQRAGPRPLPCHRIDKPVAGVGMALPARLQHMAQQEQSGEQKTILQVLIRPAVRGVLALAQKRRQSQQP